MKLAYGLLLGSYYNDRPSAKLMQVNPQFSSLILGNKN